MESKYNIVYIILLMISFGFNSKPIQPNTPKVFDSTVKFKTIKGIITDDKPIKKSKILTHGQLYSEGETLRGIIDKLVSDSLTMKKLYSENHGDSVVTITLYFRNSRIISVVDRVSNTRKEMINNNIFDFDENNICIANTKWSKKDQMEFTNSVYWGTLIRFDVNYNQIDLTSSQKHQIIKSTKASLDSVILLQ